ncbi:sugar transferase (plasmid) [Skermanella rosea]|uniref:sugar transferase n=1 Tax=Skermanella rosea TaxID=1817965 RepID=UPI0019342BEF|nr:sugar transferase [Skermanella rosea]UEM07342.1 sugar transferase [Skermanella rosea]
MHDPTERVLLASAVDLAPSPTSARRGHRSRNQWSSSIAKRMIDIILAFVLLLALAPMLMIIAMAIRWESSGPILFRQERTGLHGRTFMILKFRTMRHGKEIEEQARKGDGRITRVGSFLRTTSMDELPQLLNVFRGDMSFVGPRPHPVWLDAKYGTLVNHYDRRFLVKPGITGLAQINRCRGQTETLQAMEERIGWDLRYTRESSPRLDALIMIHTIFVTLSCEGAG